jgi:ADP-ribose pyrophosphatase YjhB (NUDIX family)
VNDPLYHYCPRCGTPMEVRTVFNRERAVCPACGFIHFTDPKVAAGVIVEQDGKVLLVQRNNEPLRGYWSFPAGFVDAYEDPLQAARRECLEETGLEVEITGLLQVIGGREHPSGADIVIVYAAKITGGQLHAGDDADQAVFFPYDQLPPLAFKATRKALGRPEAENPPVL